MCNNLIMPLADLLKNITSKDKNLYESTIKNLVKSGDCDDFKNLCENSEFIFSFIKEKIINDFVKLINKNDLDRIFKFAKIYSYDFEDLIVKSWLKYADEDLTDTLLELFEKGTDFEKTYCARYFTFIKDPLALDYLYENVKKDFIPLKINCAKALSAFSDTKILNEMKDLILNSKDEFEKVSAYTFILAYGGIESVKFCLNNCFTSPFLADIISALLDFNDFSILKENLDGILIARIFSVLIENYPENISLNTIIYYQISDFIKYLSKTDNIYIKNILAIAKYNFNEYAQNEIYSFDLDKNTKNELKNISNYLNALNFDFKGIEKEFDYIDEIYRFDAALKVINNYQLLNYTDILADKINKKLLPLNLLTCSVQVLKNLGKINLVEKQNIETIKDNNIRAFLLSCYS